MGCVNTSSRKFKELAAKNNVDINALELITHKYWLEKGSEEFFPTDVYIQAQLGNVQYEEHGKAIQEMWKNNYSTPQSFNSLEELTAAQQEARKYFPQHALVHYKDAKGKYVLRVKQPVKKISVTKGLLDNGFLSNVARIDLGLQSDATYGIDKVQELFEKFNQDRTSKFLADKVFKAAKDLGLKITFDDSISISAPGRYTNDNTIKFNKAFFERDWMNNKKSSILLHEVIHAMTMYALSDKTQGWQKSEAVQHFANEINSIFQDVRNNAALESERGKTDVKEFVAELANPVFRKKLQSIDKGSFWKRLVNAIKSFLGIKTASTYYNRAMNALDEALDAFDMDTYTKYTKIGDILQQAYQQESIDRGLSEAEIKQSIKEHYLNILPLATSLDENTQERLKKARQAANAERNSFTYAMETEEEADQVDRVNKRIESFKKDYGDLVKKIVPTNNRRGGMSYSVTLKSVKEILDDLNAPVLSQLSMIDNMSKDDILSNMMLLEQEAADYVLVNKGGSTEAPNIFPVLNDDTTVVVDPEREGLASGNSTTNTVNLKKSSFTPEEVISHLKGESGQKYSDQKKAVLEKLKEQGISIEDIESLLTDEKLATSFIVLHEKSHIANKDHYNLDDYMSDEAIAIETRATKDAYEQLKNITQNQKNASKNRGITFTKDQIQKHSGNWSRQEAQSNPNILYVFTDNTDRNSGSGKIADDSWYSKKYGVGHHFPTMTAAVVRGLDNSRPISTQRWYHSGAKGTTGRWTDANLDEFKSTIKAELQDIVEEFNTGKYDTIMFPDGDGLFNTSISNISKERTPKLYQALGELLHEFGFDILIPSDITLTESQPYLLKESTIKINLPNYQQYETDKTKLIEVDAAWKVPLLYELDERMQNESMSF